MPSENFALKDQFAKHLKIETITFKEGYAKVKMIIQPEFLNGVGLAQGGVLFTLADYAFALAANAGEDSGLGVNANINFIRPAHAQEELVAETRLISRTRKLGTYQTEIFNQNGEVLARMQSLAYFKA